MKPLNNETDWQPNADKVFDHSKINLLAGEKKKLSFNERLSNRIAAYTKEANEKIWRDIEYYRAG